MFNERLELEQWIKITFELFLLLLALVYKDLNYLPTISKQIFEPFNRCKIVKIFMS